MIHFFIVLCILDLPERHNFAHVFLLQKYIFFLLLHILYSYRNSIFTCGVFLFVITLLFFCISGLSFRSAPSKYGSLHPKHKLKLLKAFFIDVFFEFPVYIVQSETQDSIVLHRQNYQREALSESYSILLVAENINEIAQSISC